jgi:hypothetical protein
MAATDVLMFFGSDRALRRQRRGQPSTILNHLKSGWGRLNIPAFTMILAASFRFWAADYWN